MDGLSDGWDALAVDWGEKVSAIETAAGQVYRRWDAVDIPRFSFTVSNANLALVEQIESLKLYTIGPLSFRPFGLRNRYGIPLLTDGLKSVTLPQTPYTDLARLYQVAGGSVPAVLTGFKVFLGYDPGGAPGGTDYYASGGGAYDPSTRQLSWSSGTSPGSIGTRVYVNLQFSGVACWIQSAPAKPLPGSAGLYSIAVTLTPANAGP